jgi:tetratricopeptide (TPR) repeat protein
MEDRMNNDLQVTNSPLIRSVRRDLDIPSLPIEKVESIGRTHELAQLATHFADDTRPRVAVLTGIGGSGKTRLASAFAHRIASKFPDGVFFHSVEGEDAREVVSETIKRLAPTARIPHEHHGRLSLYRDLLAGKRVLTILDGLESEQTAKELIPPPPSALLVTSRRNILLPNVMSIQLGMLSLEEAALLLRSNLDPNRKFELNELVQVADALDRHPLTLTLAAEYLNSNPQLSIQEWLSLVSKQRNELPTNELVKRLIARVLGHSHEPPEQIAMLAVFEGSFKAEAAQAIWDVNDETARKRLDAYAYSAILEKRDGRFGIHEMIKEYFRETFSDAVASVRLRHATYFLVELSQIADQYHEPSRRSLALEHFNANRMDIEAGHAWAEQASQTSLDARNLLIGYATTGFELFATQLPATKWIGWIQSALDECKKNAYRGDHALLLYAMGIALMNQGDMMEAQVRLRNCIDIANANSDRRIEGAALGVLGLAFSLMGDLNEAIKCYEHSLDIAQSLSDKVAQANAIGNLGVAYASIGDIPRAVASFEQQLAIANSLSDIAGAANAIGNLGLARRSQDDLAGARNLFEKQLALSREISDLRGQTSALSNLGSVMLSYGDLMEAAKAFEEAMSIARHLGDRWQESRLIGNLGNAYLAANQIAAAIDAYAQQTEIAKLLGDRIGEGNALWNSAIALEARGDIEMAIAQAKAALDIRRQLDDPNLAKIIEWLRAHGVVEGSRS